MIEKKPFWKRDSGLTIGDVVWIGVFFGLMVGLTSLWAWEEVIRPWTAC